MSPMRGTHHTHAVVDFIILTHLLIPVFYVQNFFLALRNGRHDTPNLMPTNILELFWGRGGGAFLLTVLARLTL
jgi:hypothetical protein